MELRNIINICKHYLYTAALKRIDTDSVRSVFAVALAAAREKVEGTETPFDDWLLDAVEAIIADDAKMAILVDWIRGLVTKNICQSAPETDYETLAHEMLYTPGMPKAGSGEIVKLVALILQTVIPLEQFDDKFALIQMPDKIVNIVDDLSDTGSNCEGKLKSIVSGQTISSDRKFKSQISFEPTARLIFACNTLPRQRDKSNGFFRRLTILRFNKTIPESQKRPEFTTKKFWKQKVAGIFNWCLDGLLHLRCDDNHFYPCPESDEIKEEYRYFGNSVLRFLDEYVELDPNGRVLTQVLYDKYKIWAKDHGHLPVSSETLGMDLKREFNIEKKRSGGKPRRNYYPGIRLIDEDF